MFDNIVMFVLMVVAVVITAIVVLAIVKHNSGTQGANGVNQREFNELRSQYEPVSYTHLTLPTKA